MKIVLVLCLGALALLAAGILAWARFIRETWPLYGEPRT